MVAARLVEMPEMTKQTSAMRQITPLPIMAPTSAGLSQMTTPLRCPSKCPQKAAFMTPNDIGPCDDESRTPSMRQCVLVDRAILHDDQEVFVRIFDELDVL